MSTEEHDPLPLRQPRTHLPARYRAGSAWPSQDGIITSVRWAASIDYELLARVHRALPHV